MLKDKLDLGSIEHLDFEIEEKKPDEFGHLYTIGDPGPSHCGLPRGQGGHKEPCNSGLKIPRGSKFCPHCGVPICPTCFAISQYLKRRGL